MILQLRHLVLCGSVLLWATDGSAQSTGSQSNASGPALATAATSSATGTAIPNSNSATSGAASSGSAAPPRNLAGTIAVVDGTGSIYAPDHTSRAPKVGDQIFEGDSVVTKADGEVHLDMADGGYIAVRPNTIIKVSKYQANGDDSDHSVIGLFKGSLRSITGWIGKSTPKNYAIVTPTATIGVRGTDHEPAYVPEGTAGQDAGTYDNVHAGGTTISNAAGHIDVEPNHAGFVDRRANVPPRVLDHVPAFFSVPHAHDNLFIGKHEKVMASLEKRRAERVVQHRQELQRSPLGRPGAAAPERREMPRAASAAPSSHPFLDRLKAMQQHAAPGKSGAAETHPGEARPAEQAGAPKSEHPLLDRMKAAVQRKPAPEPEKKKVPEK